MIASVSSFSDSHHILFMAKQRKMVAKDQITQMICGEGNGTLPPSQALTACLQPLTSNQIEISHSICTRDPIFLVPGKSR
jgi:hypothetical protein